MKFEAVLMSLALIWSEITLTVAQSVEITEELSTNTVCFLFY